MDLALGPLLVTAAALYLLGTRRRSRIGRPWPLARSLAFVAGVLVLAVAALSPLAAADTRSFPAHVAQHLLLGMAAPPLLALGAPLTLALQTAPDPARAWLRRSLHHPVARVLAHPLVGWAVFSASLWALYYSPVLGWSLHNGLVHEAVHLHFLAAGLLFFWPVVAADPGPHRIGPPTRLLLVALTIPLHAFLGLALLSRQAPLEGYAVDDVHRGAALLWAAGDLLAVATLAIVVAAWIAEDGRVAAREDRAAGDGQLSATRRRTT